MSTVNDISSDLKSTSKLAAAKTSHRRSLLLGFWGRLVLMLAALLLISQPAFSQAQVDNPSPLPELTGPQKNTLVIIAREVLDAVREGRPSREATVETRLTQAQPMVVSIYVDGILRARAWRLREFGPIYLEARNLTYQALAAPKVSNRPLLIEELSRAEISLAVLSNYTGVRDESQINPREAVIIYNGFIEWMAMPGDVPSNSPADLLTYACEQAGLRPQVWLLPQTTIFTAKVEGAREGWDKDS